MLPTGIEPVLQDPQSCVLSVELREHKIKKGIVPLNITQNRLLVNQILNFLPKKYDIGSSLRSGFFFKYCDKNFSTSSKVWPFIGI